MKTAYQLRLSQVQTPNNIITLFWQLIRDKRPSLSRVLDLGAGDGRFAYGGHYRRYEGIEIDPEVSRGAKLPPGAHLITGCAFRHPDTGYDACVGNPPYVRHHDIESPWKEQTTTWIQHELGIDFNRHGNLYLYFLCLGLIKTHAKGLVGLLMPFEWVSRPSASSIRSYIEGNCWNVSVYHFEQAIFNGVLTTASISIVDKCQREGNWSFHDVSPDLSIKPRNGISGRKYSILSLASRGSVWARRGISPGSQKIFTLTEGERIHAGLRRVDVVPCVTTLKSTPRAVRNLNWTAFRKYFIAGGQRCWLIKSGERRISSRLKAYLDGIPKKRRQAYTCLHQEPWFAYERAPTPKLLVHSGFTAYGPKVLINLIGAQAVGSVYGVHADIRFAVRKLQMFLLNFNFERRIVPHAKTLKKVEVRQLNTVLNNWTNKKRP